MGNKLPSPIPSYETALSQLNKIEIEHIQKTFKLIGKSEKHITQQSFSSCELIKCSMYVRKYILPRLFHVIDTKRDGLLDIEEYISAIALFRIGSTEEKIMLLFLMYEPQKNGFLLCDNLRQMLVDATIVIQKNEPIDYKDKKNHLDQLEHWIHEQLEISTCMTEMALQQFAQQQGKITLSEFVSFVKVEGSIQQLLNKLPQLIDN
jgi:Ca2+-binding EF-hand superfamily protein